ncbi:gag/pol protein [Cucumis melo var. makuwa]|uniref:Gag/pol protein n=1 Tax=Cucumis melo var. makuwa TaxID=1194695 RepID=A0A5D3DCZ2_CUCMM|nr:gag/pol protein [Cucumis melo var. makuwa]
MSSSIIALLKKDQLTGRNYGTWKSKLNMILVIAELRFVLIEECPPLPSQNASQSVKDAYDRWTKVNDKARLYILSSMSDILNKKHEIMVTARQIMDSLREMFGQSSIQIKQEAIKYVYYVQMNEAVFNEKSQVSYILKSLSKSFLQFRCNVEMNKIEYNMTTFLRELQNFQSLKGQKEGKANVTHSRRFAPSSSGSKKIQKKKGGKGKGSTVAAESKGKAKVAIKGKCFHYNVDGHSKRNCPKYLTKKKEKEGATNHVCSFLQKTSSFKQLEEDEMTFKVGTGDVISARVVGDAKYGYLYLMEHKSEALEKFKEYKAGVDRGGKYMDLRFQDYMIEYGIQFQLLAPDHMKDQKLRSKLVLNGAIDGSTRVVDEVGPLSRVDETTTSDKDQWVKAMDLEMESMYFNSMWELVDLPEGSIRILLSIATFYDYEIWKMDVNTAFLHGNLEESIFMSQLEGFITQGQEQKVCKLNRSIYGLKQASRSWNIRHGVHLSKEQCPKIPQEVEDMRRIPYASAVGSLMYVMLYTRAYICYAGEIVSSIKQGCIADSTMEAEYVTACEAGKEAV